MVQEVMIGCPSCGRPSRLGTVSSEGRTTLVVNGCQVVCAHCSRRISVDRRVFAFNPAGSSPIYSASVMVARA